MTTEDTSLPLEAPKRSYCQLLLKLNSLEYNVRLVVLNWVGYCIVSKRNHHCVASLTICSAFHIAEHGITYKEKQRIAVMSYFPLDYS